MKHSPPWITAAQSALSFALVAGAVAPALASAQANADPGIDVLLSGLRDIEVQGRLGAFPSGVNGVVVSTSVCNEGTAEVPWFQPMNPHHPMIAFLAVSVRDGRLVQISNRSYVKHGFFALNGRQCSPCQPPASGVGEYLGVGCSDTYATVNNGDNFYLGPPDELDPWLGVWQRRCSLFDRGFPDVGAPANCDGLRSLTHQQGGALGPVNSRVQVRDEDLLLGGELFFQAQYVVEAQPDAARANSLGSRAMSASWNGNRWDLALSGPQLAGSVLQRWPGALVTSATNGDDDGRVFAAVQVSGPVQGFYRYEYALHNRDNARAVGRLRIPLCPHARVRNAGFRDLDQDAGNDWASAVSGGELAFASVGAPLRWNSIDNFWFESDAAPGDAGLTLEPADPGPGQREFTLASRAPTQLFNVHLGPGCALDTPPTLYAGGAPPRAELGNARFALVSAGNAPFQPNFLLYGLQPGAQTFHGCPLWTGAGSPILASLVQSDAGGVATHASPIPSDLSLEGKAFRLQAVGRDPRNGVLFTSFELSEGLLVRIGNAIPSCP